MQYRLKCSTAAAGGITAASHHDRLDLRTLDADVSE
jgi:hypothetical protein